MTTAGAAPGRGAAPAFTPSRSTSTTGPYALSADPPAWATFRDILAAAKVDVPLEPIEKWEFYKAVTTPDHVLTIQTADQQRFANLLLSIGVRMD